VQKVSVVRDLRLAIEAALAGRSFVSPALR
jgi:hypothetical protein